MTTAPLAPPSGGAKFVKVAMTLHREMSDMSNDGLEAALGDTLSTVANQVSLMLPTIAESDADQDFSGPGSSHSYEAHDSGFMMFAVETDGYGTFHAVDSKGREIARSDQISSLPGSSEAEQAKAAYHQLIDRLYAAEA